MSPPLDDGVWEAGVAVIERDPLVESLVDLHFGAGEAKAAGLLRDLEAAAFPLHDVVVANGALVHEAADTLEAFRGRSPGGFHFARLSGETAVVVSGEISPHGGWRGEGLSARKAGVAGQAILQDGAQALQAGL